MSRDPLSLAVAALLVCLASIAACQRELSGAEAAAALSLAEPTMVDLFAGLVANDYRTFSSNFDEYMQESIPETYFEEWTQDLDSHLGTYLSRQVHQVMQSDEFYVVEYQAGFEKEDTVTIGVAIHMAEPHTISHLWIESDEHRWAPEPPRGG